MKRYNWDILDELPEGWVIDKTVGSPIFRTVFITNGKSVLNGQKRALLRVHPDKCEIKERKKIELNVKDNEPQAEFPSETVNELARKKFQLQLLREINFDLMVCELEGWDKKEYINQLKELLNKMI